MRPSITLCCAVLSTLIVAPIAAQEDIAPPVLVDISVTPDEVDVTTGPADITVSATITDPGSGIDYFYAEFYSSSYDHFVWVQGDASDLVSGTTFAGNIEVTGTIPRGAEPGVWILSYLQLKDLEGNWVAFHADEDGLVEVAGEELSLSINVISPEKDVTSPTIDLTSLSVSPSVDIATGSANFTVTATIADDLSGIGDFNAEFRSPSASPYTMDSTYYSLANGDASTLTSGTASNGTIAAIGTVPESAELGTWTLVSLNWGDQVGNNDSLDGAGLTSAGVSLTFDVVDVTPPINVVLTPTLSIVVTSPEPNFVTQPGSVFSSENDNAVTAEIRLSVESGDDPVTSVDLNSIVFPTDVVFDGNSVPTNVVIETTEATSGWTFAAGPSIDNGEATVPLDIGLVAGSGADAAILYSEAPPEAPLAILTLTYNTAVTVPLADNAMHADLNSFGATDIDLGSITISANSAFAGSVASASESISSVIVDIIDIVKGDVSGDGDIASDDAQQTLLAVANDTLSAPSNLGGGDFWVQLYQPSWTALKGRLAAAATPPDPAPAGPLNIYSAFAVADVDEDTDLDGAASGGGGITGITAFDAANMLRFAVGQITDFGNGMILDPLPPVQGSPGLLASSPSEMFSVSSTSSRPGAQVTVSLDLVDVRDLYAGELRLDYDTAALRPVDVRIESPNGTPLIAHSTRSDDLGIAFASATPIEDGVLQVVFEAASGASDAVPAHVRAKRLVLNRTRIDTGFEHRFLIEPYQFQLMANYPNPFNPETWIPFELAEDADVTIRIYGMDGTRVRTLDLGRQPQGIYASRDQAAYWDGRNDQGERVASGVYVYQIAADAYHATRRMVIMK